MKVDEYELDINMEDFVQVNTLLIIGQECLLDGKPVCSLSLFSPNNE